jgi:cell wall-associated NlpC family hydrolase
MTTLLTLMAMQYLNVPYKWGGQSYDGLDCSGFVLKTLHDVGITLPDMTAHGLFDYCESKGHMSAYQLCDSLLFFGKPNKITHVAISLGKVDGQWLMIEAGGAGRNSLTMSQEELAKKDARVRIKPVNNRSDLVAEYQLPYKEMI